MNNVRTFIVIIGIAVVALILGLFLRPLLIAGNDGTATATAVSSGPTESESDGEVASNPPTATAVTTENTAESSTATDPIEPTAAPTETAVPTEQPTEAPTTAPPPTATEEPTAAPTETAVPTDQPTETPTTTPTETAVPPTPTPEPQMAQHSFDNWLGYVNYFRAVSGLPPVTEDPALSSAAQLHAQYMVFNDDTAHNEQEGGIGFSPAGRQAAADSNLFATSQTEANYRWSINFWVSAPFHIIPILDPSLKTMGYGEFTQAGGNIAYGSALNVHGGQFDNSAANYPIMFPGDGGETWVVRYSLYEFPDALTSCGGFSRASGSPIILQLGSGDITPRVDFHTVIDMSGTELQTCSFDETNYTNSNAYTQQLGRTILDNQDAIVIIPSQPLAVGKTYEVFVVVNNEEYRWQFSTVSSP